MITDVNFSITLSEDVVITNPAETKAKPKKILVPKRRYVRSHPHNRPRKAKEIAMRKEKKLDSFRHLNGQKESGDEVVEISD